MRTCVYISLLLLIASTHIHKVSAASSSSDRDLLYLEDEGSGDDELPPFIEDTLHHYHHPPSPSPTPTPSPSTSSSTTSHPGGSGQHEEGSGSSPHGDYHDSGGGAKGGGGATIRHYDDDEDNYYVYEDYKDEDGTATDGEDPKERPSDDYYEEGSGNGWFSVDHPIGGGGDIHPHEEEDITIQHTIGTINEVPSAGDIPVGHPDHPVEEVPDHMPSSTTPQTKTEMDSNIRINTQKDVDRQISIFAQPSILAAFIGGAVMGLLCAILLVMFIVYRMRKRDEGSYPLDEPKRVPLTSSYSPNDKEIYA